MDKQLLTVEARRNDNHPIVVGSQVFDHLLRTDEILTFGHRKYMLLQLLLRDIPIEEASERCGFTLDKAIEFRDSDKAQSYIQDRLLARILAEEAQSKDRWWVRAEGVMQGHFKLSKGQTETFKEIGKRVVPVSGEGHGDGGLHIEINIDPEAIERARARKSVMEAEVVSEV